MAVIVPATNVYRASIKDFSIAGEDLHRLQLKFNLPVLGKSYKQDKNMEYSCSKEKLNKFIHGEDESISMYEVPALQQKDCVVPKKILDDIVKFTGMKEKGFTDLMLDKSIDVGGEDEYPTDEYSYELSVGYKRNDKDSINNYIQCSYELEFNDGRNLDSGNEEQFNKNFAMNVIISIENQNKKICYNEMKIVYDGVEKFCKSVLQNENLINFTEAKETLNKIEKFLENKEKVSLKLKNKVNGKETLHEDIDGR